MFKVGDRVEIIKAPEDFEKFLGLTGEVIAVDEDSGPYISPDSSRPDGWGTAPFYWDSDDEFNPDDLRRIDD